jgi:hypothetical protein
VGFLRDFIRTIVSIEIVMSDSEDIPALPSDSRIASALRTTVADIFNSGNLEDLTLKRVRKAVEQQLKLPEDFLKTSQEWKEKSKDIVNSEVVSRKQRWFRLVQFLHAIGSLREQTTTILTQSSQVAKATKARTRFESSFETRYSEAERKGWP